MSNQQQLQQLQQKWARRFKIQASDLKIPNPIHDFVAPIDIMNEANINRYIIERGVVTGNIAIKSIRDFYTKSEVPYEYRNTRYFVSHQDTLEYVEMVNEYRGLLGVKKIH